MKTSVLILGLLMAFATALKANVPVPADKYPLYTIEYFLVPHAKLGQAVSSAPEAANIEKDWKAHPEQGGFSRDFSIVIFVHTKDAIPALGQLRVWLTDKFYRDLPIIAPTQRRANIYVLDGGLFLLPAGTTEKKADWLSLEYMQ